MTVELPRQTVTGVETEVTKLRRARDQYQAAFDAALDPMVLVNDDQRIVDANEAAAQLYGVAADQLPGRAIGEFMPDSLDLDAAWEQFKTASVELPTAKAVGFSVDSRSGRLIVGRRIASVHVQRPAVQAHAQGCASVAPSLVATEIP